MPNILSKFHTFIDVFMRDGTFSMILKAFTLLKYLSIDDNQVRMRMQTDSFKPWCNLAENEEWIYKPHYAHAVVDG